MGIITYKPISFDTNKDFWVRHVTHKNKKLNYWDIDIADGHRYISLSEKELRLALKFINDAKRGRLRVEIS